jgi:hypothetical protein
MSANGTGTSIPQKTLRLGQAGFMPFSAAPEHSLRGLHSLSVDDVKGFVPGQPTEALTRQPCPNLVNGRGLSFASKTAAHTFLQSSAVSPAMQAPGRSRHLQGPQGQEQR